MTCGNCRELQEKNQKLTAEIQQVQAQYDALKQRSIHLESMLKNATAFAAYRLSVDPDNSYRGRIVMVSDSLKDILGVEDPYDMDQWFEITHPDDFDRVLAAQAKAMETFHLDETIRFFHSRRNEWRWIRCLVTGKPVPAGHVHFFEGILTDVTDQKYNELELDNYRNQLEKLVEKRTKELSDSNRQLQQALKEKEQLFREMHHRVHNNLVSVMTLLDLQSRNTSSEVVLETFQDCQDRIRAMCMVHSHLYKGDDSLWIDADHYLDELVKATLKSYGIRNNTINVSQQISGIVLPADQAITLGLVINELVCNSIKHGFKEAISKDITFSLTSAADSDEIILYYADSGPGMSWIDGNGKESTLGISLIKSLVKSQLKGNFNQADESNSAIRLVFPAITPSNKDFDPQC